MTREWAAVPIVIILAAAVSGCSGSNDSPSSPGNGDRSFSSDVQPIFTANCSAATCHGLAESEGLRLTDGDAYGEIVNVPSTQDPNIMRVLPSRSDSSYLLMKVGPNPPQGDRMPRNAAPLSSSDISTITDWVDEGAENN